MLLLRVHFTNHHQHYNYNHIHALAPVFPHFVAAHNLCDVRDERNLQITIVHLMHNYLAPKVSCICTIISSLTARNDFRMRFNSVMRVNKIRKIFYLFTLE